MLMERPGVLRLKLLACTAGAAAGSKANSNVPRSIGLIIDCPRFLIIYADSYKGKRGWVLLLTILF
jgi:hypothetical protein